jgi:acyl carrier protein
MRPNDLNGEVQAIFQKVFRTPELRDDDSPESIDGWDSLGHLMLVIELEARFGISISTREVAEMVSVRNVKEILCDHGVGV